MVGNYFETKITREETAAAAERRRTAAEVATRQRAEAMEHHAISEIQRSRDSDYVGVEPAEVWGTEAGELCSDFMAYMDAHRVNGNLSGARSVTDGDRLRWVKADSPPIKRRVPLRFLGLRLPIKKYSWEPQGAYKLSWSISGYAIAHSDPFNMPGGEPTNLSRVEKDVILCEDGLLRRVEKETRYHDDGGLAYRVDRVRSLEVVSSDGRVNAPLIGHFTHPRTDEHHALFVEDHLESVLITIARNR